MIGVPPQSPHEYPEAPAAPPAELAEQAHRPLRPEQLSAAPVAAGAVAVQTATVDIRSMLSTSSLARAMTGGGEGGMDASTSTSSTAAGSETSAGPPEAASGGGGGRDGGDVPPAPPEGDPGPGAEEPDDQARQQRIADLIAEHQAAARSFRAGQSAPLTDSEQTYGEPAPEPTGDPADVAARVAEVFPEPAPAAELAEPAPEHEAAAEPVQTGAGPDIVPDPQAAPDGTLRPFAYDLPTESAPAETAPEEPTEVSETSEAASVHRPGVLERARGFLGKVTRVRGPAEGQEAAALLGGETQPNPTAPKSAPEEPSKADSTEFPGLADTNGGEYPGLAGAAEAEPAQVYPSETLYEETEVDESPEHFVTPMAPVPVSYVDREAETEGVRGEATGTVRQDPGGDRIAVIDTLEATPTILPSMTPAQMAELREAATGSATRALEGFARMAVEDHSAQTAETSMTNPLQLQAWLDVFGDDNLQLVDEDTGRQAVLEEARVKLQGNVGMATPHHHVWAVSELQTPDVLRRLGIEEG